MRPSIRAGDYLRLSADRYPERRCFVHGDGSSRTFRETNDRVNKLASSLTAHGVAKGDRVAILDVNSAEFAEVLFACLKLGATYVPLNNRLGLDAVMTLLQRAEPAAVFVGARYVDHVPRHTPVWKGLRLAVVFDGTAPGFVPYETVVDGGDHTEPDLQVGDDDVLGLAFTSGTTGQPKGVLQSQRMIKSLTIGITMDYEIGQDEFRYSSSPMFHIGGQSPVFMHVWRGFPTLVLPQFAPAQLLPWMQNGGLTGCFLVPTMLSILLDEPGVDTSDYPELRSIIYGAAPMSATLLSRSMEIFGCEFVNAFGAGTEAGLQTVLSSADHRRAQRGDTHLLGSIGRPAFGVDLRLIDEDERDVPVGKVGEIITRSDQVMNGYLGMPEATASALKGGWFRAGDLARRDEEGYLYLAGRRTDMIIRGGENIYPVEVEEVLDAHASVAKSAVVGVPDDHLGEVVVAWVVARDSATFDEAALRAHARSRLASYQVPLRFEVIDELPMNAGGKVLKTELRARSTKS